MKTLFDFLKGQEAHVFTHDKSVVWTNGVMVAVDDPQLLQALPRHDALAPRTLYRISTTDDTIRLQEDRSRPFSRMEHVLQCNENELHPASLFGRADVSYNRRACAVRFDTPIWGDIPGGPYYEDQFDYLYALGTHLYHRDEGAMLYFKDDQRIRGLTTVLRACSRDEILQLFQTKD